MVAVKRGVDSEGPYIYIYDSSFLACPSINNADSDISHSLVPVRSLLHRVQRHEAMEIGEGEAAIIPPAPSLVLLTSIYLNTKGI